MDIDSDILLFDEEEEDMSKKEKDNGPAMRLLKSRKIIISNSIDSKMADKVLKQLLMMDDMDKEKPITVVINSPGGEVYSGWGIFDAIRFVDAPVNTVVIGLAASMGSIIFLAGDNDRRFITPNSKIMIHQPLLSGIFGGTIADIEIEAAELIRVKQKVIDLYVESTGKKENEIKKNIERNTWLNAEESVDFGLATKIVNTLSDIKE